MTEDLYYIQDTRSVTGNCATWWRANGQGYTCDLNEAWKVSYDKASSYRDTDVPRRVADVDALAKRHFDVQDLRKIKTRNLMPRQNPNLAVPLTVEQVRRLRECETVFFDPHREQGMSRPQLHELLEAWMRRWLAGLPQSLCPCPDCAHAREVERRKEKS